MDHQAEPPSHGDGKRPADLSDPAPEPRTERRGAALPETAQHLRVLIANERQDRLAVVAPLVQSLGHEVIAREITADKVAEMTNELHPDVALVGVGGDSEHALDLIDRIVKESTCPVIALLHASDDDFVRRAAMVGVFAYIVDDDPGAWQNMIEIVLRRFLEYHSLEGAFGRRALIERAKGILMERHAVREDDAFLLIRDEARSSNRRVVEVAESLIESHPLLPPQPAS
jgi:AmiR/NasT family two-component response regulator